MSKVVSRVVQKTGEFENKEGEKKNSYVDLGVIFENDKGYQSMKLNALPLPNKDGEVWVNIFPIEPKKKK